MIKCLPLLLRVDFSLFIVSFCFWLIIYNQQVDLLSHLVEFIKMAKYFVNLVVTKVTLKASTIITVQESIQYQVYFMFKVIINPHLIVNFIFIEVKLMYHFNRHFIMVVIFKKLFINFDYHFKLKV